MKNNPKPGLYGIRNSNRNFTDPYYWGKNQFNSSFPVALACFMRDKKHASNYLKLDENNKVVNEESSFDDIFNTTLKNDEINFLFETRYDPFSKYVHDDLKSIDLVLKNNKTGDFLRPLEIKLTTLPDNSTSNLSESEYGCELVVRNPTTRYIALSMSSSLEKYFVEIRKIFEPACHRIRDWDNSHEIQNNMHNIFIALETFFSTYQKYEKPLLMQPVWKTVGKSAMLADNCLDVFVWSDFAATRLFMDSAINSNSEKISRPQRAAIRLARFLFEISRNGRVYQEPIYDGMTYDTLNDKEFAISGVKLNTYMKCDRLTKPIIKKSIIKQIILGGGQNYLSPERRFDAIIYFSKDLFD
ncbi:MAG: HindVP family restriction endonuclease [bacterium]